MRVIDRSCVQLRNCESSRRFAAHVRIDRNTSSSSCTLEPSCLTKTWRKMALTALLYMSLVAPCTTYRGSRHVRGRVHLSHCCKSTWLLRPLMGRRAPSLPDAHKDKRDLSAQLHQKLTCLARRAVRRRRPGMPLKCGGCAVGAARLFDGIPRNWMPCSLHVLRMSLPIYAAAHRPRSSHSLWLGMWCHQQVAQVHGAH